MVIYSITLGTTITKKILLNKIREINDGVNRERERKQTAEGSSPITESRAVDRNKSTNNGNYNVLALDRSIEKRNGPAVAERSVKRKFFD